MTSIAACTAGRCLPAFSAAAAAVGDRSRIGRRHRAVAQALLAPAQLARLRHGGGAQVTGGFLIDQPGRQRRCTGHALAAADHADGARDADDARQPLRAACAGDDAQRHLRQTHHRAGRGDACVAAQRQLEAAAQRRAVQRRDHGLAAVLDGADHGGSGGSASGWPNSRRSEPAMKVLPAPISTAPRRPVVAAHRIDGREQAFAHCGRTGVDGRVVDDRRRRCRRRVPVARGQFMAAPQASTTHAVGGAHALPLRQHEDRVDLGLDQALAQLRRHAREGDDGIHQRVHVGLGPAAEAVQQRPGLQLLRHAQRLGAAQAALASRQQAHRRVLEQLGGDAAHAQQDGRAQRVAVHAEDQLRAAADHLLHQEALRAHTGLGFDLGRHLRQARAHRLGRQAHGHAADVALVRDLRRTGSSAPRGRRARAPRLRPRPAC